MKKLLAFVFVFATVVVATNVLSSCKDYDEDNYDDLQLQLARNDKSLRDLIGGNYEELCSLYNLVKDAQEECSIQCNKKQAELDSLVTVLTNRLNGIKSCDCDGSGDCHCDGSGNCHCDGSGDCHCDGSGKCNCDLSDLTRRITEAEQDIAGLKTDYQRLEGVVNKIEGSVGTLVGQVSADSATIVDLLGKVGRDSIRITNIYTTLNDYIKREDITNIMQNFLHDQYTKEFIENVLQNYINNDYLTQNFYNKTEVLNLINQGVAEAASNAEEALQRAKNDSVWIAELWKVDSIVMAKIDSLCDVTQLLEDTLDNYVLKSVYDQFVTKTNNEIANLKAADKRLENLIDSIDSLRYVGDDLLQKQINAIVLALGGKANVDDLSDIPVLDLSGIRDSLANIWDIKLPALEDAFKTADQALQDQIDDINDEIDDINDRLDDIEDEIDALKDRVSDLEKKINQITAIIPQATVNPVFGTFAAPVGISSKVLMAFYGEITSPVEFPTNATANYVKYSDKFTASDWSMISSIVNQETYTAGTIVSGEKDGKASAGTLYVTVNPSEEDFEGQTLKLVNSKDEESKVTLTPLKAENNYEIMFGYTRAASANGLYKAEAKLDKADIDAVKISLNKSELQDAFKAVLSERNMPSLGQLGTTLYDQFNGFLPAQALKAEWTTTLKDGSTYKRTFRSEYGIAATAIEPLSFGTFDALNYVTVPGYEQAENFLNDVIDEIKDQLKTQAAKYIGKAKDKIADMTPELKKLAILKINNMAGEVTYDVVFAPTMTDADGNTYIVRIDMTDATPKVYDAVTGKLLYSLGDEGFVVKSDGVHVTVTDKVLYNYLADGIMSVNQLVGSLEDFIEDVNDLVASVSTKADPLIDKAGNKIYSKLHSYLDKINRKLVNFVNTTGARIQPTLLVVSGGGTKLASGVSGMPTKVDAASVNLIPTTYTAEIVAPAYKKHIIAVDVIKGGASAQGGDTDCKNALNAFNGQVNKVIDGTSMESIPVTLESGYTYVVAYSALDYHGKISMQKFYIKY